MDAQGPDTSSAVCFYVPVYKAHIDTIESIGDTGRFTTSGCWDDALQGLADVPMEPDVITVLFGDLDSGGSARWIAVVHNVELLDEGAEIIVHCLRELPHPFPTTWLRRLDSAGGFSELNTGDAALCESPAIVTQYLAENEISSDYDPHPLLFPQCVTVRNTSDALAEAQCFDVVHYPLKSDEQITVIEELLMQASVDEKVLLAAFSDPRDHDYLGWVTTIDDMKVSNNGMEMTCYVLCDFRRANPRIPFSQADRLGHVILPDAAAKRDVGVCQPSWLMNECLNLLDTTPTVEDFSDALKAANLSEKQIAMLSHHYRAPNHTISMGRLAEAMGYKNFNAANLHYGKLAARIGELLGFGGHEYSDNINILAAPSTERNSAGHFQWTMRAELVLALEQLGLVHV